MNCEFIYFILPERIMAFALWTLVLNPPPTFAVKFDEDIARMIYWVDLNSEWLKGPN